MTKARPGPLRRALWPVLLLGTIAGPAPAQQSASLTLSWNPVSSSDLTAYRIYFGAPGALVLYQEVPASQTSLEVTGLEAATTYCAEITSLRGTCESDRSVTVCALPTNLSPTIVPLTPVEGDTCVDRDGSLKVQIQDPDSSIDVSSILVRINGVVVTPTLSGSASSLTLTMPVPTSPPADGVLDVEVTVSDLGAPSGTTTFVYTVRLKPPAPTGLRVS